MGFVDEEHGIGVGDDRPHTWWSGRTVADLSIPTPMTVTSTVSTAEAVELLQKHGFDQLPVVDESNSILGVVTEGHLTSRLMAGRIRGSDPVAKSLYSQFRRVQVTTRLSELARIFDRDHFAVVVQTQRVFSGGAVTERSVVVGVVSRIDLLKFITHSPDTPKAGALSPTVSMASLAGAAAAAAAAAPAAAAPGFSL